MEATSRWRQSRCFSEDDDAAEEGTAAAASNLFKVALVGFKQPADVFIVSQGRFSRPGLHCAHRHKRAPSPNPNIFITQRQKHAAWGGDRGFGHVLTRFAAILSSCLV